MRGFVVYTVHQILNCGGAKMITKDDTHGEKIGMRKKFSRKK
jgi:hypothetical protein